MSKHQKRMSAPRNYPVERKDGAYVVKAEGPHPDEEGIPIAVVLRDALGYADTMDEVKELLSSGKVLVNGRPRNTPRSNVGFMDIISFPAIDETYRVLVGGEGFVLVPVAGEAGEKKLARIDDKTTLKGGVTQLNLHDGNNIETGDGFDTKSSVLLTLPDLEIEEEVAFNEGNVAYITGGRHVGETAEISSVNVQPGSQQNIVTLEGEEEFETVEENVFMVGTDEPLIEVGHSE